MIITLCDSLWKPKSEEFVLEMIRHSWDGTQKNSSCYQTGSGYDIGHLISESSFQPSESPWTSPMNFYSLQEDERSLPFDEQRQQGQGCTLQEMPPDSFRPVLVPLLSVQKRTSSLTSLLATDSWISPSTRNEEKRRQQYGDNGSSGMGVTFPEIGGKVLNMALVMSSGRERPYVRRTAVDDYMPDRRTVEDFDELDSLSEDLSEKRSLRGVGENTSKNRVRNRDRSYDRAELNSNGHAPTNEKYYSDDTEDFEARRKISGSTWDAQISDIAQRRQIGDQPLYHRNHSEATFHEDHSMRIIPIRNQSSAFLSTKEQNSSFDIYSGSMCRYVDSEIEGEDDEDTTTNIGRERRDLTYSKGITFHSGETDGNSIDIVSKIKRQNTVPVSPTPLISAMRNTAVSSTETAVARYHISYQSFHQITFFVNIIIILHHLFSFISL